MTPPHSLVQPLQVAEASESAPLVFALRWGVASRDAQGPVWTERGVRLLADGRLDTVLRPWVFDESEPGLCPEDRLTWEGDWSGMQRLADLWYRIGHQDETLLAFPLVAAHLAHAALRNQTRQEVDALASWTLQTSQQPEDPSLVARLHGTLSYHIGQLARRLAPPPSSEAEARRIRDSVPEATAKLIQYLAQLGPYGKTLAAEVRHEGLLHARQSSLLWEIWLRRQDESKPSTLALRVLALAVWQDEVCLQLAREARSKPLRLSLVQGQCEDYTHLPKITAPFSWTFGAPGLPAAEVGGDQYAQEPSFLQSAALLPRSWKLLPADHQKRPHQTAWPAEEGESDALPVALAGSQGYVLSPQAAKLALLLLASSQIRDGEMAQVTLGELTQRSRPDVKRLQARDHEATARGLEELHRLFLFLPDHTKVAVFVVQSPQKPELARPEMRLYCGLNPIFSTLLAQAASGQLGGPDLRGQEYRGSFLMNLSGAMRLPNNQPSLLRYYVRIAAAWNAAFVPDTGAFSSKRFRALPLEEWAALSNSLQKRVSEYLLAKKLGQETPDRRPQLSMDRKHARQDLEALAEEYKLIRLESRGELIRPLPPEEYLEAWELFRTHGGRSGP